MAGHRDRRAFALLDLLVVMAILGTLLGISIAGLQQIRVSSARLACQNNMRQIGLAILNFHDQRGYFPPAYDGSGNKITTWLKLILPEVGYENARPEDPVSVYLCPADRSASAMIYEGAITLSKFNSSDCSTTHSSLTAVQKPTASNSKVKYACTGYVAVVSSKNVNGPYDAVIYPMSRTRATDIRDGQSNTLLVGERPPSADLVWGWWASPYKGDISMGASNLYRFAVRSVVGRSGKKQSVTCPAIPFFGAGSLDNPCDVQHFWSLHPGGGNWLFADGSVHFFRYETSLQLPSLASRAGGEVIDWRELD